MEQRPFFMMLKENGLAERHTHGTSKAVRIFVEQDNTIIFRDYISKTGLMYKHIHTTQEEITLGMNLPDITGEEKAYEPTSEDESASEGGELSQGGVDMKSSQEGHEDQEMTEENHDPAVEVAQDIQPPRRSYRLGAKKRVGYQEHITTSGSTFLTEQDIYDHGTSYYAALNVEKFSPDPKHEHQAGPEWMDAELQEIANLDKYGVFRDVGDINTLQRS